MKQEMLRKKIKVEKKLGKNKRIEILNTKIDVLTTDETVKLVEQYVLKKEPLHLMGVNADKINEVNQNEKMKEIVNSCGIINADGAATGFMGLGMMNMASGGMTGGVMQNAFAPQQAPQQVYDPYAQQQAAPAPVNQAPVQPVAPTQAQPTPTETPVESTKICTNCGTPVTGKFCSNCGTAYVEPVVEQPAGPRKCSNCGAELLEGAKFCVECGTSAQ